MTQAAIAYRHNQQPRRGLALAGAIFCVKAVLLIPHLIIIGVLQYLAYAVAYIGFWIVAFTGKFPDGLQSLIAHVAALGRPLLRVAGRDHRRVPAVRVRPAGLPHRRRAAGEHRTRARAGRWPGSSCSPRASA